ncbi:MAG TPA: alginate export family protein, partial [Spirochaetota bacterium]|nr:alginate export family protein [Spirochaetota bacterium]
MNSKSIIIMIMFLTAAVASYAADDEILPEEYIPDLSADADMAVAEKPSTAMSATYGGWVTPIFISDRRGDVSTNSSLTLVKVWGKLSLGGNSFIYIRAKDLYTKVFSSDNYDGDESKNLIDIDTGYIELATSRRAFSFAAGRKFFLVGSGTVLAGRGDGADIRLRSALADLQIFGMYTRYLNKDDNPYDRSSKDRDDGARRVFAGASAEKRFLNQTAYLFGVIQRDRAAENATAKIRYQSQYFGGGIKGVPVDGLDYLIEGVYEQGKSYLYNSSDKKSIGAYALNASANYYINTSMNPALSVQYAFASGDNDRYSS